MAVYYSCIVTLSMAAILCFAGQFRTLDPRQYSVAEIRARKHSAVLHVTPVSPVARHISRR